MSKGFCVDFLTGLGKLLTAGMLISSCSHSPYYGLQTEADNTRSSGNLFRFLYNRLGSNAYSVPSEDRDRHQRCVFFALEQLDIGERCKWANTTTNTTGEVRVVHVYPTASRICSVFMSSLQINGVHENWQDTACWSELDSKWRFISKS